MSASVAPSRLPLDGFTVIEAGPAPIWGDAALGEDIAPYRAVAGVLQPCRMPCPWAQAAWRPCWRWMQKK